jgi:hypothetical protein
MLIGSPASTAEWTIGRPPPCPPSSTGGCIDRRLPLPRRGQGWVGNRAIAAMFDAHVHPPAFIARSTVPRNRHHHPAASRPLHQAKRTPLRCVGASAHDPNRPCLARENTPGGSSQARSVSKVMKSPRATAEANLLSLQGSSPAAAACPVSVSRTILIRPRGKRPVIETVPLSHSWL